MASPALENDQSVIDKPEQLQEAELLIAQADTLMQQNQFKESKSLYEQALALGNHAAVANHGLGLIEANTTSVLNALPYFETAIKTDPTCEQYWVSYIDALLLSDQRDKAKSAIVLGQKYGLTEGFANQLLSECEMLVSDAQASEVQVETHQEEYSDFQEAFNAMLSLNKKQVAEHQFNRTLEGQYTPLSPDVDCSPIAPFLNQWLSEGHYQEILTIADAVVSQLVQTPELVGHKIYTPFLDHLLAKFDYSLAHIVSKEQKGANIILASELYNYGGHTKEIASLLQHLDNPILIVTDIYNRFAESKSFQTVSDMFPECPVLILPEEAVLQKSKRLAALINQLARNVYLLVHHNDSTAIAACQPRLDVNYYYVHHGDHNAALGNHSPHFKHVDLFANRAENCAQDLNQETVLLPAAAKDHGAKTFSDVQQTFATVTAGSFGKFKTEGNISLSKLIIHAIQTTHSPHYHFGTIPDQELANIQQALTSAGISANKFAYKGNVSSLWEALKEIDAHVFIGSAPVMGAKSDIEAQGAGYPLLAFKSQYSPRHLNVGSHAPETIYWHDIESFKQGLDHIRNNHQQLVEAARQFYLSHCTPQHYEQALATISG